MTQPLPPDQSTSGHRVKRKRVPVFGVGVAFLFACYAIFTYIEDFGAPKGWLGWAMFGGIAVVVFVFDWMAGHFGWVNDPGEYGGGSWGENPDEGLPVKLFPDRGPPVHKSRERPK